MVPEPRLASGPCSGDVAARAGDGRRGPRVVELPASAHGRVRLRGGGRRAAGDARASARRSRAADAGASRRRSCAMLGVADAAATASRSPSSASSAARLVDSAGASASTPERRGVGGAGHARPCWDWKASRSASVCAGEEARDALRREVAREVLLEPEHVVAAAAARAGPARAGRARRSASGVLSSALTESQHVHLRGPRPVPPGDAGRAVGDGEVAEAHDLARRRRPEQLADGDDRAAVDAVVDERLREDRVDARADALPVHLRQVELRAAGAEEDRVGEVRMVADVGERGERQRVASPTAARTSRR